MKRVLITCILFTLCISGCNGLLIPDSLTVTAGQARYREEDAAYRGFTVGLQWNLGDR